jgi:hypothetical protein
MNLVTRDLFQPFDFLDDHFLVVLTELALQTIVLLELGVLLFDVAVLTDTIVAGGTGADGHADLDLERAVTAATSAAWTTMVLEGEHTETLVAKHAVILVLLVCFLRDQLSDR